MVGPPKKPGGFFGYVPGCLNPGLLSVSGCYIIIIIIINAKIKVTLNTNVAGALYKNY